MTQQITALKQNLELQEDLKEELKQVYNEYDELAKTIRAINRENNVLEDKVDDLKARSVVLEAQLEEANTCSRSPSVSRSALLPLSLSNPQF